MLINPLKIFPKIWTFVTDVLNALLGVAFDIYSFIMTSRISKIVFTVSIIIFVYIGIGIVVYFSMFQKNKTRKVEEFAKLQMVEQAVPQTSPALRVESKSEIAIPHNADQVRVPVVPPVMAPKQIHPKEPKSAIAPDKKNSDFSKSGKKKTVHPGTKLTAVKSAILKVALQPLTAAALLDGNDISTQDIANGKIVEPGSHVIIAEAPGFEPYYGAITVEPGVTRVMNIVLTKAEKAVGLLHVYSYPWSDLYVDGVLQGTTPTPKPLAFEEGEHALLLKRQGFKPYSETIRVQKGQVTRVQINLEKLVLSESKQSQ